MERITVMSMKKNKKSLFFGIWIWILILLTAGCSLPQPNGKTKDTGPGTALEKATAKVQALGRAPRIIATSPATVEICNKLDLDLVGVPNSSVSVLPGRYKKATRIGAAMNPDMEKVSSLSPDWILAPISLKPDLQPKFEAIHSEWAFLNLSSINGMFQSIQELGKIFHRQKQANRLVGEYQHFVEVYRKKHSKKQKPKVLILMGLPGSYVIGTNRSYVGSLVELAGGESVYQSDHQAFVNVNTEELKKKDPDVILRAAHALPDKVQAMFDKDFKTNDIWKHFDAVAKDRVYDLSYRHFGMSANFEYQNALKELEPMLYPKQSE